jgi:hypothetical protein
MRRRTIHLVVGRVDQNLVYYLEEAGNVLDVPLHHAFRVRVIRPNVLGYTLYAANVRVRSFKNVLQLGELFGEELDPVLIKNAAVKQTFV